MKPLVMQDQVRIDEVDLALVNALQIQPRAPWALVGRVLGIDPVTAARRWARLEAAGMAWVSCYPPTTPDTSMAFIELVCEPGYGVAVAQQLAGDPQAISVDVTAGDRDVFVTVLTPDRDTMSEYLLDRLGRVRHLQRVRSHVAVRLYTEGSRWRLRSLDRHQSAALRSAPPEAGHAARTMRPPNEEDWAIAVTLATDGRASIGTLAAASGVSVSTARRRLDRMLAGQQIRLRCEFTRALSGWPVNAWLFTRVQPSQLDEAGRLLARIPEVRTVTATAGPCNLIMAVWLRSLSDVPELEKQISREMPYLDIVDRSVVVRPIKLVGRLLGKEGHATGAVIPVDTRRLPTTVERWRTRSGGADERGPAASSVDMAPSDAGPRPARDRACGDTA
ncbi:MAG: Lrp/AsnC family transcriptional regulator [Sciscionella sp.]